MADPTETRLCVVCHQPVRSEESMQMNHEIGFLDEPMIPLPFATTFDGDEAYWWIHVFVPFRDEYADIFGLHESCVNA